MRKSLLLTNCCQNKLNQSSGFTYFVTYYHSQYSHVDISGVLFILRIQYESYYILILLILYEYTQCQEGARDVNNIRVTIVIVILLVSLIMLVIAYAFNSNPSEK